MAAWIVWTLRAQLAAVYLFAGLAKLNTEWLLRAQPLQLWFADRTAVPLIGGLLDEPAVAYLASWGGAVFDLTIVAWLLWRPSRKSGNIRWTEEGYHLSWRVMLTDKAGFVDYDVTDPATGRTWQTGPDLVLTDWQQSQAANRPDLIQATAHLSQLTELQDEP